MTYNSDSKLRIDAGKVMHTMVSDSAYLSTESIRQLIIREIIYPRTGFSQEDYTNKASEY